MCYLLFLAEAVNFEPYAYFFEIDPCFQVSE